MVCSAQSESEICLLGRRARSARRLISLILDIAAPVVGLLFDRRPAYVARLIAFVVVDPVERHVRVGAQAYLGSEIGKKRLETITPAGADPDPPPSVIFEGNSSWIKAAVQDPRPYSILS